jgi:hypothetical protein
VGADGVRKHAGCLGGATVPSTRIIRRASTLVSSIRPSASAITTPSGRASMAHGSNLTAVPAAPRTTPVRGVRR